MLKENNKINLIENTLKTLFFVTLVFTVSYIATDIYCLEKKPNNINVSKKEQSKSREYYSNINTQPPRVNSISNTQDAYYVIFKNADPSIKQIELFLANNQHKLSSEELEAIEHLRNKKITELMARKYVQLTSDN